MHPPELWYALGYIVAFLLSVVLSLWLQYIVIKSAVYKGMRRYHDSLTADEQYVMMRDAVTAGMLSYDEQKREEKSHS